MGIYKSLDFRKVVFSNCFLFFLRILQFLIVINTSEGVVVVEMRDFSNSLMNQVGVLKGEKELTNVFIEYFLTMLLEERKLEQLRAEIDEALDNRDKAKFIQLTEKMNKIQQEMLAFE
ncbi:IDEAL domain-containing protein [Listeria ivanovii]|uniref:IDEAL domain-containing protein n=1 Tax=Listeria ivanovii TaxID=1638 RepID=UPI000BA4A717|nr:IDEAL domain-containing protein [Listeria ivanovii]MBC1760434.1 IDEAL domain-containing protein [Listeria ivanovii]MBK3913785.1 IDEAL domain-containing protein [Listeria ivanovii subsp. ivanovii]MBK3921377.1 IDEAL domain-containing protein [Listeria ivanovii subsp. ivanovii]MBK3926541.1 IDEAL domain-containing protein [Listeria ivanovii subsp. ivanovii]MCJ1716837.1 IDEAL domain-containing protein [Listeria ivanovii]